MVEKRFSKSLAGASASRVLPFLLCGRSLIIVMLLPECEHKANYRKLRRGRPCFFCTRLSAEAIAFSTVGSFDVSAAFDPLEALASQACPGGGWGYALDQPAHLEPTCLALLALSRQPQRYGSVIEAGRNWLHQCAAGDGTYRLQRGRPEAVWPTALVLFVHATLGEPAESLHETAAALLRARDDRRRATRPTTLATSMRA